MINQEEIHGRITDAPWYGHFLDITVGGAGGLGSNLAMLLSRIGHNLAVYDMDNVSGVNLGGGQFYTEGQVGEPKTHALRRNVWDFAGSNKFSGYGRYEKGMPVSNVCITTFDNMEARKDMFDTWRKQVRESSKLNPDDFYLFINMSMLSEGGFIEVVDTPKRANRWKKEWVPSEDIEDLPCSFKSTTHNCYIMAGMAVSLLNNFVFNKAKGMDIRYLPYRTIVDLNLLTFDYED